MMIFCIFLIILLLIILSISIYYNIKFGITILRTQDAIEAALDQLDKKYITIAKILEKPVFFDSLEVRQTVDEIKSTQELLLYVANCLTEIEGKKIEKKDS